MITFDATVDFDEPGALEAELEQAIAKRGAFELYGAHIPADGDTCELGELLGPNDACTRNAAAGDWYVIGRTAAELPA